MAKVRLLLYYGVKPILVFDGAHLPMKRHQENQRAHSRRTSRNKANELLAAGNDSAAHIHIQKAADITPQMAAQLIVELQKAGVQYVVAPYEADAQMAYLDQVGMVSAVITEDSDLLLFGCKRVLFKLDSNGSADEICIRRLGEATELDFSNFSLQKFRHLCMLSGCDYLPSIHGMGLKTAYKYLIRYSEINRVLQALRAEMPAKVPENYESDFVKAEMTFLHQRVYDLERRRLVFLNPIPVEVDIGEDDKWDFLGPNISEKVIREVCEGRICPNSWKPFDPIAVIHQKNTVTEMSGEESLYPLTPPSSLPFEVHLDRRKAMSPIKSKSLSATSPVKSKNFTATTFNSKAISAARVSLKRSLTTGSDGGKENVRPMVAPRLFAFSATERMLAGLPPHPLGQVSRPSKVVKTIEREEEPPIGQKSIRDFFRSKKHVQSLQ